MDTVFLELDQFQNCLGQFAIVPFDYSLISNSPLAFVENRMCPTDEKESSDACVRVWFLWEDMSRTYCSWSEKEPQRVIFKKSGESLENLPPILKSEKYLKKLLKVRKCVFINRLLQLPYDKKSTCKWFGDLDDFLAYFDGFKKFPFDYKEDLPRERPLVFEDNSNEKEPVRFFLRKDNSILKCTWGVSRGVAHLCRPRCKKFIPPALWNFV